MSLGFSDRLYGYPIVPRNISCCVHWHSCLEIQIESTEPRLTLCVGIASQSTFSVNQLTTALSVASFICYHCFVFVFFLPGRKVPNVNTVQLFLSLLTIKIQIPNWTVLKRLVETRFEKQYQLHLISIKSTIYKVHKLMPCCLLFSPYSVVRAICHYRRIMKVIIWLVSLWTGKGRAVETLSGRLHMGSRDDVKQVLSLSSPECTYDIVRRLVESFRSLFSKTVNSVYRAAWQQKWKLDTFIKKPFFLLDRSHLRISPKQLFKWLYSFRHFVHTSECILK